MTVEISEWLEQLGLEKYAELFIDNEIDIDAARHLTEDDLKEMDLPIGPRKKLLHAIAHLSDQSEEQAEPQVATQILAEPVVPTDEVERRQVAVLFADLTGYTRLSSELDPEHLNDLMDRFFKASDEAIASFGGTVDKHLGDGVMAVFGAPVSHGDDTLRAVRAASSIHEGLREVSSGLDRSLSAHIGIASGEVLAGAGTREYTVIGDAVNLASRLSDLAKAEQTLLSDEVHSEVFGEFLCAEASNVSIKGLQDTVSVWKVLGSRKEPIEQNLLPFVGREAERAQFRSTIETVEAQSSGATFIFRGEPGIGKTRLATECLSIAVDRGFDRHHSLVLDFGSGLGSDPLRTIFKSLLHAADLHDTDALRQVAKQMLAIDLYDADDEAYVFDLLDIPMSSELQAFYRAIENATRNWRKIELVGRLLEERSRQQPQVILIEDLHWADQITRDLCSSLAAHTANCPAVLVITSRIEGDPFDSAWRSRTGNAAIYTIDLRPLSTQETLRLVEQAGAQQVATLNVEIEKAGGNPLFVEMLIRSSADSQKEALPGNLRSLVQARIDRLLPTDRNAIQAAAVIGQRFDMELVRDLIGEPNYEPTGLMERSLINPMGDQFLFAHALVQESVYASITRRNAHAMHRRAAQWFDGRDSILRAEHLARAEDDAAPTAYLLAARDLMANLRFVTANGLIDKGLSCARDPGDIYELNKLLGNSALQSGDFARASNAYKTASRLSVDDEQICTAYLGVAASNRDLSGPALAEADEYLSKAKDLSERLRLPELQVRHRALLSFIRYAQGDIQGCYDSARDAVSHAEATEGPKLLLNALESFGSANYQVGRFASLQHVGERMLELARSQNDISYQIKASYQLTITYFYLNQFSRAIEISSLASQSGVKYGAIRQACMANEYLARVYLALGDLERARETCRDVAAYSPEGTDESTRVTCAHQTCRDLRS